MDEAKKVLLVIGYSPFRNRVREHIRKKAGYSKIWGFDAANPNIGTEEYREKDYQKIIKRAIEYGADIIIIDKDLPSYIAKDIRKGDSERYFNILAINTKPISVSEVVKDTLQNRIEEAEII